VKATYDITDTMYCRWCICCSKTSSQEVISKRTPEGETQFFPAKSAKQHGANEIEVSLRPPKTPCSQSEYWIDVPGALSKRFSGSLKSGLAKSNPALRGNPRSSLPLMPVKNRSSQQLQPNTTLYSDWGDAYDSLGSIRLSNQRRTIQQSVMSSVWSDNNSPRKTESTVTSGAKMSLKPGTVMAMQQVKMEYHFTLINLDNTLQEVVKNFLTTNSGGIELPVSFNESENIRPKLLSSSRMAMTLRENLGRKFNLATHGLTFSTGSLNSKLCFKMSICDLRILQRMFSFSRADLGDPYSSNTSLPQTPKTPRVGNHLQV